jgi:hypothetical protein
VEADPEPRGDEEPSEAQVALSHAGDVLHLGPREAGRRLLGGAEREQAETQRVQADAKREQIEAERAQLRAARERGETELAALRATLARRGRRKAPSVNR